MINNLKFMLKCSRGFQIHILRPHGYLLKNRIVYGRKFTYFRESKLQKPILFIHIPKTGGQTIQKVVLDERPGHYEWYHYEAESKLLFNNAFKFAVVRHPIDRLVSAYNYLKNGGNGLHDYLAKHEINKYHDINDFIQRGLSKWTWRNWIHFVPQSNFIFDNNNNQKVDFIAHQEQLQSDFSQILRILGEVSEQQLPYENMSRPPKKAVHLTKRSDAIVRALYERDFRNLGY